MDMILVPSLLALALRNDEWYIRSQIIWSKQNPMPESVNGWRWERHKVKVKPSARASASSYHAEAYGESPMGARDGREFANHSTEWQDCPGCSKCQRNNGYILRRGSWRPTDSFEVVWMMTKTNHYYCDREAVMEQGVYPAGEKRSGGNGHKSLDAGSRTTEGLHNKDWNGTGGRNLRSVWDFPTQPFPGAHFAVFPPRLPEICIKASTSEAGCCPKCGAPYARVVEKGLTDHDGETDCLYSEGTTANRLALLRQAARERGEEYRNKTTIDVVPAPENGSRTRHGTVPLHSHEQVGFQPNVTADVIGRVGFGIDTSAKYIRMAQERFDHDRHKIATSLGRNNWKGY